MPDAYDQSHQPHDAGEAQPPPVPAAPPAAYAAPPTNPYTDPLRGPPKWAKVVGTIMITFGCLGLLGGLWSLLWTAVMPMFTASMPDPTGTMAQMNDMSGFMLLSSLVMTALAIMLLVAGIGIVKRRPWAPSATIVWSILKILYGIVSSVAGYLMQRGYMANLKNDMAAQTTGQGQQVATSMMSAMEAIMPLFVLLQIAFVAALPVFLLWWLTRKKIRADIATWGDGGGQGGDPYAAG